MDKFLTIDANGKQIKKDVGVQVSAGAADAGKAVVLKADGTIDSSMFGVGVGGDSIMMIASETLAAGNIVSVWDNNGAFNVRKSDATAYGKKADGFVLDAATATQPVKVYFEGTNTGAAGLVPGDVFLSTTAGGITQSAPSTIGNVIQKIGTSITATSFNVEFSEPIELA